MEKVATRSEIMEGWTLEDVITANEMLDYMAVTSSGDGNGPGLEPGIEQMLEGLK